MTDLLQDEAQPRFMPITTADFLRVLLLGALIGVATYGVALLLRNFVFGPITCEGGQVCANAASYGEITSAILLAIVGLLGTVRLRVFRPMIVVVAATASLWGLMVATDSLAWHWGLLAHGVLYGLAYGIFTWAVRIRRFWVALVLSVMLIVVLRYVMTS